MRTLPEDRGWMGDRSRGASLGRSDAPAADPAAPLKFTLQRVRLDSGGYDSGGSYWGHGQPLYWACCGTGPGELVEFFLRADDREHAKEKVRAKHPGARFFR